MIDIVKLILRITTNDFDAELTMLINSCKTDLSLAGVNNIDIADDRIKNAICLYCKANFGYREDMAKFQKAYETLRDSIALSERYSKELET